MKLKIVMVIIDLIAVCVCLKFMSDANPVTSQAAVTFLFGRCLCTTLTQE